MYLFIKTKHRVSFYKNKASCKKRVHLRMPKVFSTLIYLLSA